MKKKNVVACLILMASKYCFWNLRQQRNLALRVRRNAVLLADAEDFNARHRHAENPEEHTKAAQEFAEFMRQHGF